MSTLRASGLRAIARHPRRSLPVGLVTTSALGVMTRVGSAKRNVLRAAAPLKRAATDRQVRRESRRAAADATRAWRRAEHVGVAKAFTDRRVARNLRQARRHMSRAASCSISPPRHRLRNTVVVVAGVGVGGAVVVKARRATSSAMATPAGATANAA